jgi:WD40 repeat protein
MSEIQATQEMIQQPVTIIEYKIAEQPKSTEVTEEYLQLTPEGRAKINYVDGLLNTLIDTPNIELKKDITKHLENIEHPKYEKYKELMKLKGHTLSVNSVSTLHDGRIVSGSSDHTIRIWNPEIGKELIRSKYLRQTIYSTSTLPDGRIVTGQENGDVSILDSETGKVLGGFCYPSNFITLTSALPNGQIAAFIINGSISIVDPESRKQLISSKIFERDNLISPAGILPDGRIVVNYNYGDICILNSKNGELLRKYEKLGSDVSSATSFPDGRIVVGLNDGSLSILDPDSGKLLITESLRSSIKTISTLPECRIVVGLKDGSLSILDLETRRFLKTLEKLGDCVNSTSVLPDSRIVAGMSDGTISVFGDPRVDYKKFYDLAFPKK